MEGASFFEVLKVAPQAAGVAGMCYVAFLSYRRSNEAERHIQEITDKFLAHIELKDRQLLESIGRK